MWPEAGSIVRSIGINGDDIDIVARYRRQIDELLPDVVDRLYTHLYSIGCSKYFVGVDVRDLKTRQISHWGRLFDGVFDEIFENYSRVIGHIHRDRSVSQALYLQSYAYFSDHLLRSIEIGTDIDASDKPALVRALIKFIFFDMTVSASTYHIVYLD